METLAAAAGIAVAELILIWAVTMGAAVLRSFTGFGFALTAVPVYAFFLTPGQAVVLSASLALGIGIQTLPQYAGKAGFRQHWPVFALAAVGTVIGARILQQLELDSFRLALGLLTIVASLVLSQYHPPRRAPSVGLQAGSGLCSGIINGAFAIPGPPIIIYSMATEAEPARSRAFMIGFFTFSSLVALASFNVAGLVSWQSLILFLLAYPAVFIGDKLGYALFLRHGGAHYRRIAVATCLLIGLSITLRAIL
ncbi:MAG: sulfite exporter TauE/SafE family protein [Halieaceae bacterium]